jgi:hypothetical protein
LTVDTLDRGAFREALERAFEMAPEDAAEIADVILERFAAGEEVSDETLDADLRSVFYTLEGKRMLSFRREEITREAGDKRRAFFWKLRPEAFSGARSIPIDVGDVDVYATLPASAWHHAA